MTFLVVNFFLDPEMEEPNPNQNNTFTSTMHGVASQGQFLPECFHANLFR